MRRILARMAAFMAVAGGAYVWLVRPWHLSWGATAEEARRALPGDEIVPSPVYQYTRAIMIAAPAERVWPWLLQIGQGRGGFYSYDWLENLVGFDIHSADRIVPALQNLRVGDTVRMNREGSATPSFTVATVDAGRALVLRGGDSYSWSFVLQSSGDNATRLLIRARARTEPAWLAPLMYAEPITFLMERKMLRGIKERAERA